jgi:diguanylate cyclase (GGDEF)-like protein
MSAIQDIHSAGLIVQSGGAALIALMLAMLNHSQADTSLRLWAWGWCSLSVALAFLLLSLNFPDGYLLFQPAYLFGEYLFLYLLVLGCANHVSGRRAARGDLRLVAPALVLAVLVPILARGEFARLFLVQSFILSLGCLIALWTLWPALRTRRRLSGIGVMVAALALLALTFAHYLPIFGAHIAFGATLPQGWLALTSAGHLLLEFVLGFGSSMIVLERVNDELRQRNRDLSMASEQFREQAERDHLTGAFNRRAFDSLSRQISGSGCVAMIDVDRMKVINDRFGHAEGDRALCTVANHLRSLVRNHDRLFRWGGDELLLVMPGIPKALLEDRLEHLNQQLHRLAFNEVAGPGLLSVSCGIGEYRKGDVDLLAAVRNADTAMYARKSEQRSGRNGGLALAPAH